MKKLNLKSLGILPSESLTREQLRLVTGGSGVGSEDTGFCSSDADCGGKTIYCNGTPQFSGPGRCYNSGGGSKCHYSVGC